MISSNQSETIGGGFGGFDFGAFFKSKISEYNLSSGLDSFQPVARFNFSGFIPPMIAPGEGLQQINCNQTTEYLEIRFCLVGVGGLCLAILSISFNLLLMFTLFSRQYYRNSHFLYCACIATCDVLHGSCYIGFMVLEVITAYTQSWLLSNIWHNYLLYLFAAGHILAQTTSYLLVAFSLERLFTSLHIIRLDKKRRLISAACVFLFSLVCKGTILFEITTGHLPECKGTVKEYQIVPQPLLFNPYYQSIWCFWFRTIITIFVPFLVLSGTNSFVLIQQKLDHWRKLKQEAASSIPSLTKPHIVTVDGEIYLATCAKNTVCAKALAWLKKARKRLKKGATRTMVAIVVEYLVCTGLALTITIWEFIDEVSLHHNEPFYTLSADVISLLVVASSLMRLPTYCICDVTFRKDVKHDICSLLKKCGIKRPKRNKTKQTAPWHGSSFFESGLGSLNNDLPNKLLNEDIPLRLLNNSSFSSMGSKRNLRSTSPGSRAMRRQRLHAQDSCCLFAAKKESCIKKEPKTIIGRALSRSHALSRTAKRRAVELKAYERSEKNGDGVGTETERNGYVTRLNSHKTKKSFEEIAVRKTSSKGSIQLSPTFNINQNGKLNRRHRHRQSRNEAIIFENDGRTDNLKDITHESLLSSNGDTTHIKGNTQLGANNISYITSQQPHSFEQIQNVDNDSIATKSTALTPSELLV